MAESSTFSYVLTDTLGADGLRVGSVVCSRNQDIDTGTDENVKKESENEGLAGRHGHDLSGFLYDVVGNLLVYRRDPNVAVVIPEPDSELPHVEEPVIQCISVRAGDNISS